MDELASPGYQVLTAATKEKLATLSKGQIMLRHPHFSQPIFVKFPRPNVLRGPDGVNIFPPAEDLPLEEAVFLRLSDLDRSITREQVRAIIADVGDEKEIVRAVNLTLQKRPDDPMSYFRSAVRKKANLDVVQPADSSISSVHTPDPDDPFTD